MSWGEIIVRLVADGYGSFNEILDLSLDQIHLITSGGKLRRGLPIKTDEDLQHILNNPGLMLPYVR